MRQGRIGCRCFHYLRVFVVEQFNDDRGRQGTVAGGLWSGLAIGEAREQSHGRRVGVAGDLTERLLHRRPMFYQVLQQGRRGVRICCDFRYHPDTVKRDHRTQLGFRQAWVRRDGLEHLRIRVTGERITHPGRQIASLGDEQPQGRVR